MCISKNAEYNQFVLENVLNANGFSNEIECPNCGKPAISKEYERVEGACINAYERIDCGHCGHHECDDEFCRTCEAAMAVQYAYNEAMGTFIMMLDFAFDDASLDLSKPVSPVQISSLKLYFIKKVVPTCGSDCNHLFMEYVKIYLRKRADWKFDQMLTLKIESAKKEINID